MELPYLEVSYVATFHSDGLSAVLVFAAFYFS